MYRVADVVFLKERKNYLLFESYDAFARFMARKVSPVDDGDMEYCAMEKYPVSRILFTAEHDKTVKVPTTVKGQRTYAGLGDTNTGILAKIGAYYLRSAYLMPNFVRTDADPSRPPEDLGRGLRIFVKQKRTGEAAVPVFIHNKPSMLPKLLKYNSMIETMKPKAILSVHGMSAKREPDIVFGFGKDYQYIGGKRNALKFKDEFVQELDRVFSGIGMKENLDVRVSTWKFMGHMNHVLSRHVAEHNMNANDTKDRRMGMQVEMNHRGRVKYGDERIPTLPYQLVIQVLGDFVYRWNNSKNGQ